MGSNPILSAIHIQTQAVSLGERFFYGLFLFVFQTNAWKLRIYNTLCLGDLLYKTAPVIAIYREGEV